MGASASRIIKCVAAALVAVIGVAIVLAFSPVLLAAGGLAIGAGCVSAIIGGGLIVGGIYAGAYALYNKNCTWKEFFGQFGKGFVIGCVTTAFSLAASYLIGPLAAAIHIPRLLVAPMLGSLQAVGANAFANWINGEPLLKNWKWAALGGAVIGFVCEGIVTGFSDPQAATIGGRILNRVLENVDETTRDILRGVNWSAVGKWLSSFKVTAAVAKGLWNGLDQFIGVMAMMIPRSQRVANRTETSETPQAQVEQTPTSPEENVPIQVENRPPSPPPPYVEKQEPPEETSEDARIEPVTEDVDITTNSEGVQSEVIDDQPIEETITETIEYLETANDINETASEVVQDESSLSEVALNQTTVGLTDATTGPDDVADSSLNESNVTCINHTPDDNASPQGSSSMANQSILKLQSQLTTTPCPVPNISKPHKKKSTTPAECIAQQKTRISNQLKKWQPSSVIKESFVTDYTELFSLHEKQRKEKDSNITVKSKQKEEVSVYAGNGQKVGLRVSEYSSQTGNHSEKNHSVQENDDNFEVLDSLTAESLDSNAETTDEGFKTLTSTNNYQLKPPNGKQLATVHKLIAWSDEHNKYVITNRKEWPQFKDTMRVVTFMGVPGTGKTSLIQCLLVTMGYAITEIQATITRLRIGVNAYVLHEDRLIIIECCEGIDPADMSWAKEQAISGVPYGGLLIELLGYICSTKVIFIVPFEREETDLINEYITSRLDILVTCGIAMKKLELKMFTLLLRVERSTESNKWKRETLQNIFKAINSNTNTNIDDPQAFLRVEDNKMTEEDIIRSRVLATNRINVRLMRKFDMEGSIADRDEYRRNIKDLQKAIVDTPSTDCNMVAESYLTSNDFYCLMKEGWSELTDSKMLSTTVAQLHAEEVQQENKKENYGTEEFFNTLNAFIKQLSISSENKEFCEEIKLYSDDMKKQGEVYSQLKEEERTPELFVRSIIWISEIVVRRSMRVTDMNIKEKGIRLGLQGFLLLVKAGKSSATIIELSALKMALFEYKVLNLLGESTISMNYSDCWYLLTRFARAGYKLHLMTFPVWEAVTELINKTELNPTEVLVYREMLAFLIELTDQDIDYCMPKEKNYRFDNADIYGNVEIRQIAFDFEKERTKDVEDLLINVLRKSIDVNDAYKDWYALPEAWFAESPYKDINVASGSEIENLKSHLTRTNFAILYKFIGIYFSKKIVDHAAEFVCNRFEQNEVKIAENRLILWSRVADVARDDSNLFLSILRNSGLLEFIVKEFVESEGVVPYFANVLSTLCHLVTAESSHEKQEVHTAILEMAKRTEKVITTNIHTLSEIQIRNRREEQIKRWTYVRLRCLESGLVKKLIDSFYRFSNEQQRLPENEIQHYLSALITFLVYGRDTEEKRLSEHIFVARKNDLLNIVGTELGRSGSYLSNNMRNSPIDKESLHLSIVYRSSYFINRFMDVYHAKDADYGENSFFSSDNEAHSDTSVQNMDTFLNFTTNAAKFYTYFFVNCTPNRKGQSGIDDEVQLQWISLMLHLASISRISCPTVLLMHKKTTIYGINNLLDEVKIITSPQQFTQLMLEPRYQNDHRLVVVAAHLTQLSQHETSYDVILNNFKSRISNLKHELLKLEHHEQQMKAWREQQNERRKYPNSRQMASIKINLPEHFNITKREVQGNEYAVSQVFFHSTELGKTSWNGFRNNIKHRLVKERGSAVAAACLLHVHNRYSQPRTKAAFEELENFVNHLLSNNRISTKLKLRTSNERTQMLLSLSYFKEVLLNVGYSQLIENGTEYFVISEDAFEKSLEFLSEFGSVLKSIDNDSYYHTLYSEFEEVLSSKTSSELLLPIDFFPEPVRNWEYATKLKVGELAEFRKRADERVPSSLLFRLVRVEVNAKTYQAVFYPAATISCVLQKLLPLAETTGIYLKSSGRSLRGNEKLSDIAHYIIELVIEERIYN